MKNLPANSVDVSCLAWARAAVAGPGGRDSAGLGADRLRGVECCPSGDRRDQGSSRSYRSGRVDRGPGAGARAGWMEGADRSDPGPRRVDRGPRAGARAGRMEVPIAVMPVPGGWNVPTSTGVRCVSWMR